MAIFTKRQRKEVQIGLDIGSHSVKAVAILHSGPKPKLFGFSVKPAGNDIIKAIKDAHSELKVTETKVVTSISGPAVVVRYIEIPSMTEEELQSAIRFEAEKVIPYNIDEVILDFARIEDLNKGRIKVVIVAAKKSLVDTHLKMIKEAGLEPLILDADSFAVMNAFIAAGVDKSNICGLLNIGAKRSNLNIIKGEASYLSRDIDIGGNEITKVIANNLPPQKSDPEKIKEEKLLKLSRLTTEEKKVVRGCAEEVLSRLADEVRLSFDFYENQYASSVGKVYISGGTSKPEIAENYLKESLGHDTLKWDPFTNIEIAQELDRQALNEVRSQLAVAVGLGLRGVSK